VKPVKWLLIGAVVAGTFDICWATTFSYLRSGVAPTRVLQFVASGALGPRAFQGGAATAAAGLGFHYLNALLVTAAFFLVVAWLPALIRRPFVVGPLYGIVVYVVMNYVVIPYSRIGPRPPRALAVAAPELLVHMFLIGLPIALAARAGFRPIDPRSTRQAALTSKTGAA
jgi:hypothetical protein